MVIMTFVQVMVAVGILMNSIHAAHLQRQSTSVESGNCISKIHLYAETGDASKDESKGVFSLKFMYSPICKLILPNLYDARLSGKDTEKKKGDVWTLDGPESCTPVSGIEGDTFMIHYANCDRDDDWNVVDAILYAELENNDLVLLGNKYRIDTPIDKRHALYLSLEPIKRDNCKVKDLCIAKINIMAETAGDHDNAGSDDGHSFRLNDKTFKLKDRVGDDMKKNKGDLWTYTASDIGFSKEECLKFGDVTYAGFTTKQTDGWKIKTAIVTVRLASDSSGRRDVQYAILAGDVNLNKWLDKDKEYPDRVQVSLTMRNGLEEC